MVKRLSIVQYFAHSSPYNLLLKQFVELQFYSFAYFVPSRVLGYVILMSVPFVVMTTLDARCSMHTFCRFCSDFVISEASDALWLVSGVIGICVNQSRIALQMVFALSSKERQYSFRKLLFVLHIAFAVVIFLWFLIVQFQRRVLNF